MIKRSDPLAVALRVLSSFSSRQTPSQDDVAELRQRANPDEAGLPLDELACSIINRERRSLVRANGRDIKKAS